MPLVVQPPRTAAELDEVRGVTAGCVALRRIDATTCEMKRMCVRPHMQGHGIGRALADAVLEEARRLGYRSMVLDTSIRQNEAQALYRKLGFQPTQPYYDMPEDVRNWLVFMRREL